MTTASCGGPARDSAQAVRIALDTLHRLQAFASQPVRFSLDSSEFRIVTAPVSSLVLDGMAIVRLSRSCRVLSVVQTDSA